MRLNRLPGQGPLTRIGFDLQIAGKCHNGQAGIRGVPEGTRRAVGDEVAVRTQAADERRGPRAGRPQVDRVLRAGEKFAGREQSGVVVDDIFLAVVAVLHAITVQVVEGALRASQVLRAGEAAIDLPASDAREGRDAHAAAFAQGRLPISGLRAGFSNKRADLALADVARPVVEDVGIEIASRIEHAQQIVGAPQGFRLKIRRQAARLQRGAALVVDPGQRPSHQRNLLRVHEIGVA